MRLFLLPLTRSRTLLYCQRIHISTTDKQGLVDKATNKAAQIWANWEKKERGWQRSVVGWGNHALRRIPFEEWGLKSVPPVSARRKEAELKDKDNHRVDVWFPQSIIHPSKVEDLLLRLASERDALHRKRFTWCLVGMPFTIPFTIIPVIPNLPFFYLVYRAWSHWRALAGGDHLEFLLKNNLVDLSPSPVLDAIYSPLRPSLSSLKSKPKSTASSTSTEDGSQTPSSQFESAAAEENQILLTQEHGANIAEALQLPQVGVEIERAIWQVEQQAKEAENPESKAEKTNDAGVSGETKTQTSSNASKDNEKKK